MAEDRENCQEKQVSMAVVRRLPRYYRCLDELDACGVERISSGELAARLSLTASQIRQDLNNFGGFGQQGYGYSVAKLRDEIGDILGLTASHTAVLIGTGNIGRALLENFRFSRSGFELLAAFDCDERVIGGMINGYPVRDVAGIADFFAENKPDIAILTVPRQAAASTAETVVRLGIRGIWNFTEEDISNTLDGLPAQLGVSIENVHFSDSLMTLSYRIKSALPRR